MRIVKDAAARRSEILDAAEKLFGTKGYDATSTGDILRELGIARGTLYYHFKSKEDILDAMIDRLTQALAARAAGVLDRKDIPVLQRLTLMMQSLQVNNALGHEIMSQVHKPQNALMHQKMQERMLTAVVPLVTSLLQEAREEGLCQTRYPEEVTEMTLLYASTVFDELSGLSEEKRQEKVLAFIYNLERLLQMPEGSLMETMIPIFQS
ncbi:TetR/AcrR family transcriptional regulator [Faecalibaculum rodentium]|uniref:TetR/AcrR family transcriptional regulator n=2 Tax=Faecalibaculum rodentium TaxID=1702221 RepID=UPI0023F2A358|nr:TetR/AcrR family transcriptional regulator [Faecalibaculum rodentium]